MNERKVLGWYAQRIRNFGVSTKFGVEKEFPKFAQHCEATKIGVVIEPKNNVVVVHKLYLLTTSMPQRL